MDSGQFGIDAPQEQYLDRADDILDDTGDVESVAPQLPDQLIVEHRQRLLETIELTSDSFTIGRLPTNDLRLGAKKVSRNHARLERTSRGWKLIDLGSSNGTRLDGTKLRPNFPYIWHPDAKVRIGPFQLRFATSESQ